LKRTRLTTRPAEAARNAGRSGNVILLVQVCSNLGQNLRVWYSIGIDISLISRGVWLSTDTFHNHDAQLVAHARGAHIITTA
jgi:hypothetical protein